VGPNYVPPDAPMAANWLASDDPRIKTTAPQDAEWWRTFNDPKLSELVRIAQQRNPTVQTAGVRVLQARAQLGATIGDLYPQKQQVYGEVTHERLSDSESSRGLSRDLAQRSGVRRNLPSFDDNSFWVVQFGLGASWELDFWGKFRRAIESADASLLASIASYNDALVSLTAQVASTYVNVRTYEERLTQGLISLYRALGGGWQSREGEDFVRADIRETMAKRTNWGGLLEDASPSSAERAEPLIPTPEF
jgi:outer membrane protein TolC